MKELIEIENCPICGSASRIIFNIYTGRKYICTSCDHEIAGPQCDTELDAVMFWNAMMHGIKEEIYST